jgi:NADH:ubiquinone oxidoreductase subunit B-like Fe-S oxidoreductase
MVYIQQAGPKSRQNQFKIYNKSPQYDLNIGYDEKHLEESKNTKFLGLHNDNHLNWKNHIDLMILKLSTACYTITSMTYISSTDTLKSIYFA